MSRQQHLERLAEGWKTAWGVAESFYRRKKDSPALRMLLDLAEVAVSQGKSEAYLERVQRLDASCPARQSRRIGIPGVRPASPEGEGAPTPAAKKSKKKKTAADGGEWAEAKKLCRLNAETIRKAQALGFKPRALMKNRPSPSQKWKAPLKIWIEDLYAEKFGDPKQN